MSKVKPKFGCFLDTKRLLEQLMDIIWTHFGLGHILDVFKTHLGHFLDTFCQNVSKMCPSPHRAVAPELLRPFAKREHMP